jgi:hypothetical protein
LEIVASFANLITALQARLTHSFLEKKDKRIKLKKEKKEEDDEDDDAMDLPSEEDSIVMPVPHYSKRSETPSSPYLHRIKSEPGASPASSSPLEAATSPISSAYSEYEDFDGDSDPMSSDYMDLPDQPEMAVANPPMAADRPPMSAEFNHSSSQLGELFGDSSLLHHHPMEHDDLFFPRVHCDSFDVAPTTKTNVLDLSNVSIASHRTSHVPVTPSRMLDIY